MTEGQLPRGWKRTTIDEVFAVLEDGRTLHQGWSPQCEKDPSFSDKEWGVLKTTSIQPGVFLPQHNKRLPDTLVPRRQIEVNAGDLLLTCAGPRGRCGVACLVRQTRPHLMMSGKMYRFRLPEEDIDPRFIEAYLQTNQARDEIDRMKTGGSDSGLNLTHDRFRKLSIPIAPRNEQQRIVEKIEELFTQLDAGAEDLRKAQAQLKRYRQAVLKAAVTGELTKGWREAHQAELEPASELLARILKERRAKWEAGQLAKFEAAGKRPKNDDWKKKYRDPAPPDAGQFPTLAPGWIWANVGQLGEVSGGLTKNPKRRKLATKVPYLRVANVYAGELALVDVKNIGIEKSELARVLLTSGDLLVVEGNGSIDQIGRVAVWDGRIAPCAHQNHLIKVRFSPTTLSEYVLWWLLSSDGRDFITKVASSTSGLHTLSISKVASLPIPVPPLLEQQHITSEVERLLSIKDATAQTIETSARHAERMRQSILKQAFEGKLVPQEPNDEPAELLLERIKTERAKREAEKLATEKPRRKRFPKKGTKRTERAAA